MRTIPGDGSIRSFPGSRLPSNILYILTRPQNGDYSKRIARRSGVVDKNENPSVILKAQNDISNNTTVPHSLMKYCVQNVLINVCSYFQSNLMARDMFLFLLSTCLSCECTFVIYNSDVF